MCGDIYTHTHTQLSGAQELHDKQIFCVFPLYVTNCMFQKNMKAKVLLAIGWYCSANYHKIIFLLNTHAFTWMSVVSSLSIFSSCSQASLILSPALSLRSWGTWWGYSTSLAPCPQTQHGLVVTLNHSVIPHSHNMQCFPLTLLSVLILLFICFLLAFYIIFIGICNGLQSFLFS